MIQPDTPLDEMQVHVDLVIVAMFNSSERRER